MQPAFPSKAIMESKRIGFIGAGNMAQALAKAMFKIGGIKGEKIYVSAPTERNFETWRQLGATCTHDNRELLMNCDIIILAVKPQFFKEAVLQAKTQEFVQEEPMGKKLFISIIGGVTLQTLEKYLGLLVNDPVVARAMPNTAVELGAGCIVYAMGPNTTKENHELVEDLLSHGGLCMKVPEDQIDAYCGLIGSGTGFMFMTIEALSDGGVKMGIPHKMATRFAAQMMIGASKMVLETKKHPAVLKEAVCSPGGTTIAGLHVLEKERVRFSFMEAVETATLRAQELGKKNI